MTTYLIGCVNTLNPHSHIVSAQTQRQVGNGYEPEPTIFGVDSILSMLTNGDRFETYSPTIDKAASVYIDMCNVDGCNIETIRSAPDAVADNNLDNMVCP